MAIQRDLVRWLTLRADNGNVSADDTVGEGRPAGLYGTQPQAMQRLQIGVTGVVMMFLLVGLASTLESRAQKAEAASVPEAAPTVAPTQSTAQDDPLVSAGVVPDMPAEPTATPTQQPILPEEGQGVATPP